MKQSQAVVSGYCEACGDFSNELSEKLCAICHADFSSGDDQILDADIMLDADADLSILSALSTDDLGSHYSFVE